MSSGSDVVRAAGGVIWRRAPGSGLDVVLVHRAAYDDWSLPKGKLDAGETDEQAAVREVEEETGLVGQLGPELPEIRYHDRHNRPKVVRYWAMAAPSGEPRGLHEVDEALWLPLAEARERLTYARDREVLDALEAALA